MKRTLSIIMICTFIMGCTTGLLAQGHGAPFPVATAMGDQMIPQVAFNPHLGEYLAVWEDMRNGSDADIYGQFFNADGTLKGENFVICDASGHQYWPRLAFDPYNHRFLVVFEDWRDPNNGDIRGIFVNEDGTFFDAPSPDTDHTFGICTNPANIYTCSVAFNAEFKVYLVVWGDYRNDPQGNSYNGADVYGQILTAEGGFTVDTETNYPIAVHPHYYESVADVTWSAVTMEFFVVYGTSIGYVFGQRVNPFGQLVSPDGGVITKSFTGGGAIQCSEEMDNTSDCLQCRCAANNEGFHTIARRLQAKTDHHTADPWCEIEVVWKGDHPILGHEDNDVWGQRIGFFRDGGIFKAEYLDINGDVTETLSNHAISLQPGYCDPPEIDFGYLDNEFLVGWGDPRNSSDPNDWMNIQWDLYCQRLGVDDERDMIWYNDMRDGTVTETENILLAGSPNLETSCMGIAHHDTRNEFLLVFEFEDVSMGRGLDIYGMIVNTAIVQVLDRIDVTPAQVDLNPGDQQQFTAKGYDTQGSEMAITPVWSADGGDITQEGLFTAGDVGEFTVTASVDGSGVTGTATVRVWPTGVEVTGRVPTQFNISQNYPNPFNPETNIHYGLPEKGRVTVSVFDLQGRKISTLMDGIRDAGCHEVRWSGKDQSGQEMPSGIYVYEVRFGERVAMKKMTLMR